MSNNPNEAKGFYKLSWMQRIGFGAGDMAQNLIYQTVSIWLLFFYTNVFGLKPGPAALAAYLTAFRNLGFAVLLFYFKNAAAAHSGSL